MALTDLPLPPDGPPPPPEVRRFLREAGRRLRPAGRGRARRVRRTRAGPRRLRRGLRLPLAGRGAADGRAVRPLRPGRRRPGDVPRGRGPPPPPPGRPPAAGRPRGAAGV